MLPDRLENKSFDQRRAAGAAARMSPRIKLIAAIAALIVVAVVQPSWLSVAPGVPLSTLHVALFVLIGVTAMVAKIPPGYLLRRLCGFAVPFVLIGLSIPLARGAAGWPLMAGVVTKALLSCSIILILLYTTPFERLLHALRQCGVPKVFVAILAAAHRYIFVLLDELERMRRAQYARTFNCPRRLAPVTLRNGTRLIGMLFLRCSERAERVHAAMLSRGFDGEVRSLEEAP